MQQHCHVNYFQVCQVATHARGNMLLLPASAVLGCCLIDCETVTVLIAAQDMSHDQLTEIASQFVKSPEDDAAMWQQLLPECPALHIKVICSTCSA
jgi:hypothetical protein